MVDCEYYDKISGAIMSTDPFRILSLVLIAY